MGYRVQLQKFYPLTLAVRPVQGPYEAAIDELKKVREERDGIKLYNEAFYHLMYDDPRQKDPAQLRSMIGFSIPCERKSEIMPHLPGEYTTVKVDGTYARLVTHENSAKELGRVHEYLWKTFLPEHNLTPQMDDKDFCIQIYHKCPTTAPDDQINEVLIPIKGDFVTH